MADLTLNSIFNRKSVKERAQENWNFKTHEQRTSCGKKYNHIFTKKNIPIKDWVNQFEELTLAQQKLLLKSEVIRTYDSLPNRDKSVLKTQLNLSTFSSKWYKLSGSDKHKILEIMI